MADTSNKVSFKKVSKKSVRVRANSEDEDNDDMNKEEFEKTREIQKLRKRAAGTNIETLGSGKRQPKTICWAHFFFFYEERKLHNFGHT